MRIERIRPSIAKRARERTVAPCCIMAALRVVSTSECKLDASLGYINIVGLHYQIAIGYV
jgi:hypothetical protein